MNNRIEERLEQLKKENKKAFITYITAGLPTMEGTIDVIKAQEEAGTDIIQLGIPFSDPIADGPVIQQASYKSIQQGTNLRNTFEMVKNLRKDCEMPLVFMLYYNTVLHYGLEEFVDKCIEVGVDGFLIPDLPYEEQEEMEQHLKKDNAPIMIQLISPVSKERVGMVLENARGFVYCMSSMGVTGQDSSFHKNVKKYLKEVKAVSKIPVMLGFGIKSAKDVEPVMDTIDGAIVGSNLIKIMENTNYDVNEIKKYCKTFKEELNK